MLDRNALDRWITSPRYSTERIRATCTSCGEASAVTAETEYGTTSWSPEECPKCSEPWDEDTAWEEDEPDPDIAYDRMREGA